MNRMYFTITGTNHYHGQEFFEPKMSVRLVKEPDNEADREAIKVELEGLGKVGYVANSPYTVIGESVSAGRLYDKIGDTDEGTVLYVLPRGVLCYVEKQEGECPAVSFPKAPDLSSVSPDL
ncbi:MAG: HIRAN domain-containing protein [Clostridia bacterium]|nr:HIRAN domain-containing protein [Clostridia bacterium]